MILPKDKLKETRLGQIIYWSLLFILIFLIEFSLTSLLAGITFTFLLATGSYLHSLVFKRLYRGRKYFVYSILTLLIYFVFAKMILVSFKIIYGEINNVLWIYSGIVMAVGSMIILISMQDDTIQEKKSENPESELTNVIENESVFFRSGTKTIQIKKSQILYIKSEGNYSLIYLKNNKIITLLSLKEVLEKLGSANFIRIHKSYIISIHQLDEIEHHQVKIHGTTLPIGKTFRKSFEEYIAPYLNRNIE